MSEKVMGKWHHQKTRCDKCHRVAEDLLVVSTGPTTGKFCSRFCYQSAREVMEDAKKSTE